MGIPRLYNHMRPYARPEPFSSTAAQTTPLFIDGPGLAYHVYHFALCSSPPTASNPWESALSYRDLQAAVVAYLDLLTETSFSMYYSSPAILAQSNLITKGSHKIYFDGHLPIPKRPTRLSRLVDSLRKLQGFHSLNPHALHSAAKHDSAGLDVFSATASFTPRTPSLSAPPFILAATIEILSAHPIYSATVSTVPAEAESYCARDAICAGGIVLTGDSDLLLFASPSGADWGVMMFRDVHIAFPGPRISAMVFRPTAVAGSLGIDLTFLGFLMQCDSSATLNMLQQRALRIEERKKSGAAVAEYGKQWREFATAYVLPPPPSPCGLGAVPRGVEPRIAEIIQQREEHAGGVKTMFLPFLWEDPTRGSAWDAGRRIRAAAYSLLFPHGDAIEEVCRRGRRISAGSVERVEDPDSLLQSLLQGDDEKWWTSIVLDEVITVFENRGQKLPEKSILRGVAHMLLRPAPSSGAVPAGKWTWERVQIYAMAQAAWYSLLLLKEVVSDISLPASTGKDVEDWRRVVRTLPGVADCLDGARFIDGMAISGKTGKQAVELALSCHPSAVLASEEAVVDAGSSSSNGNRKRPGNTERGKKKRDKKRSRGTVEAYLGGKGEPGGGNMFSALAG